MSDTQQLRKTDRDELAVLSKAWGLPVAVGVLERLEKRVLSNPEDCAATTTETRGLRQQLVTTTAGPEASFNAHV